MGFHNKFETYAEIIGCNAKLLSSMRIIISKISFEGIYLSNITKALMCKFDFNPVVPNKLFSPFWKHKKTLRFSDVYRGYRKGEFALFSVDETCALLSK